MLRVFRIVLSLLLTGVLLWAATRAVDDCATGPYSSENCLWLYLRGRLHLPPSRLLRSGALEATGLALLAGLYLNFRYVYPRRRRRPSSEVAGP
ncbi:MAG TPA: hypothetical protein VGW33_00355 [Terriglobia bacterium]|nr:hypothetical protein [Terriglobia bacterium]